MASFWSVFDLFGKKRQQKILTDEDDRELFVQRYKALRELLKNNHEVLLTMGDMQEKASGAFVFDKAYIETSYARIADGIKSIIDNLDILADGRYRDLIIPFQEIDAAVRSSLAARVAIPKTDYVLPLQDLTKDHVAVAGGKMAQLAELANALNLPVPPGFVVSTYAYQAFLEHNQIHGLVREKVSRLNIRDYDALQAASLEMQTLVREGRLPEALERSILDGYARLCRDTGEKDLKVAVRSSALNEDIMASFAGQYESALNVTSAELLTQYKNVLASQFTPRALFYFRDREFEIEQMAMAVGVLAMVRAKASGILYTRDPSHPEKEEILVNAVWGLGAYAVGGIVPTDNYRISAKDVHDISHEGERRQEVMLVAGSDGGTQEVSVLKDQMERPCLSNEQLATLASIALRVAEHFGRPQDMEWILDDKDCFRFLQSRTLRLPASGVGMDKRGATVVEGFPILLSQGTIASRGVGAGPVFVAHRPEDLAGFPEGGVLVIRHSHPEYAVVLEKAAGVVSDIGTVLGHLATVAREYGVPALFNAGEATKVLKTGQHVTVDAIYAHVYEGIVEELLKVKKEKKPIEATPIVEKLGQILRMITPLNLTDPRGPEFNPKGCKTLHDITRFAHEVSLRAIFEMSKESHFTERSSRQLVAAGVPMQWWVIDVEDGIKAGVTGKKVRLEDIISVPLRVLWEGMTAVPWKGPPPVDAKGFLSVMLSATTDPSMDPSVGKRFAEKNYIIVSKNFCNVSTRLGFHFSTIEAYLGEVENENYVTFVFTGGGAESARKNRRAMLISRLVEQFDFRVETRGDAVFARVEGHKRDFMEERLKVLGHIIVHTRQMDMVMYNDAMVEYYRKDLLKGLASVVSVPQ